MEFEELRRRVEEHIKAGVDPARLSRLLEDYHRSGVPPGGETGEDAIIRLFHNAYAAAQNKKEVREIALFARALHSAAQGGSVSIDDIRREYNRVKKQYAKLERQYRIIRFFMKLGDWNIPVFGGAMREWAHGAHEAVIAAKMELLGPVANHAKVGKHLL